jgi:hypothetical protein
MSSPHAFVQYASSGNLNEEETYTIELMIERVRWEFDGHCFDGESERRNAARAEADYRPQFSRAELELAAPHLLKKTFMSFQRGPEEERPLRDLNPLRYLASLRTLSLTGNEVRQLSPLQHLPALRVLHLDWNPVASLADLRKCAELETLELRGLPAGDWSALASLPKLKSLTVSAERADLLRGISELRALEHLEVTCGQEALDSFAGWPAMPRLRVLRGVTTASLVGLEQYRELENLVNLSGDFTSLEPLRECRSLTHINIGDCQVRSLTGLEGMTQLREFWLNSSVTVEDIGVLRRLPQLHEATVKCGGREHEALEALRAELSSWDVEFLNTAGVLRCSPCLRLETVDQAAFDYYDTEPYGLTDGDRNQGMLESELAWLDEHLERALSEKAGLSEENYELTWLWPGARSRTLYLSSRRSIPRLKRIIRCVQEVLCRAKHDWIVYLEPDSLECEVEFLAWIYPDKIVAVEKDARLLARLLTPAGRVLDVLRRPFRRSME